MKQIWMVLIVIGILFFVFAFATLGVDGGGKTNDPDYYCRTKIVGKLIGENLEFEGLECNNYPYPGTIVPLRILGGDDDVVCQAAIDTYAFGEEKSLGDIGFTESAYYNFKISNIPEGSHNVRIRCQGKEVSIEKIWRLLFSQSLIKVVARE